MDNNLHTEISRSNISKERTVTIDELYAAKLHRVEQRPNSPDAVSCLKTTWVGRFYKNFLKQVPLARIIIIELWRVLYPVYVKHIAYYFATPNSRQWRPLVKLVDYVKAKDILTIKLLEAGQVDTPKPKVFPAADEGYLSSPQNSFNFPPIYVARVKNAMILGGTNLIMTSDAVICHDLYDFNRDYTSEELHGRHLIDVQKKRIRLLVQDEMPEHIPLSASFVDACASNYAHWLTEVLPRIAAFCAEEQFQNIPIVINDGLHPNIMESLFLIAGKEREIILLPIGRAIQLDSLYLVSVAGYVPFERRDNKLSDHSHGLFNSHAFYYIRKCVAEFTRELPQEGWPSKVYLRRNAGTRKITNDSEVEAFLVSQGYIVVEPEKLTFLQQVMLFSKVKSIVGSTGAALANIIFAPSDACVQIFIGKHPNTSYWYWQNIACSSGNSVVYILGNASERRNRIHADFTIDLNDIPSICE